MTLSWPSTAPRNPAAAAALITTNVDGGAASPKLTNTTSPAPGVCQVRRSRRSRVPLPSRPLLRTPRRRRNQSDERQSPPLAGFRSRSPYTPRHPRFHLNPKLRNNRHANRLQSFQRWQISGRLRITNAQESSCIMTNLCSVIGLFVADRQLD
jgi:hypothetical protein